MTNYMVVGSGVSGISAVRLLLEKGYPVLLFEPKRCESQQQAEALREKMKEKVFEGRPDLIRAKHLLSLAAGDDARPKAASFQGIDICVMSPGVPLDTFSEDFIKSGIQIIGEVELGYRFAKGALAAITGTNGKTTTTTLVGEIFKSVNPDTHVVGNIGVPYTQEALSTRDASLTVAEISSFMLETTDTFHPHVSAILNITPDHLNRHKTMECYIQMKKNITKLQTMEDVCVLNHKDPVLREFGQELIREKKCRVLYFSSEEALPEGLYYADESIYLAKKGDLRRLMHVDEMKLIGIHNYENVMAAIGICLAMGIPLENILDTVRNFQAVEHRIEYVDTVRGVKYYNDSKGTNPDAAIQGIKAMRDPTILLGGGYDKGSSYEEWIGAFDGKVKKLLLMGATREKIAQCCEKLGFHDYELADSFEEAMERAFFLAEPGDAVLLSPACASWGMFENYEQRGRVFKDLVYGLKERYGA